LRSVEKRSAFFLFGVLRPKPESMKKRDFFPYIRKYIYFIHIYNVDGKSERVSEREMKRRKSSATVNSKERRKFFIFFSENIKTTFRFSLALSLSPLLTLSLTLSPNTEILIWFVH
jgi:hypothetical protein